MSTGTMRCKLFKRNKKTEKDKQEEKESLFEIELRKLKKRKKALSASRAKIVAEHLYRAVEEEYKTFDVIDQKAGTQLTFLPIAVTVFAGVGGLLLKRENTQEFPELWIASISLYGMSLIAFIVSGIYTLLSIKVAGFPLVNPENIVDFEKNNADYYYNLGEHFEDMRKWLRDVNDKKALKLARSQIAVLTGLVLIAVCFMLIVLNIFS